MATSARDEVSPELGWGVGSVAARLGIAASTLRTWERRYDVGPSRRTAGGHRRYSETDIDRVMLTQLLIARGAPARDAAQVAHSLDAGGLASALSSEQDRTEGDRLDLVHLPTTVVRAAKDADPGRIGNLLSDALDQFGVIGAWTNAIAPSLIAIGDEWRAGRLGIEAEHLASEAIADELRAHTRAAEVEPTGPVIVLASAEDDLHSLPVFAVEAALAEVGIGSLVLGARLPTQSLASVVEQLTPRVVFLWASLDRPEGEALWERFGAAAPMSVILAGPGWPPEEVSRAPGDVLVSTDLRSAVDHIRQLTGHGPSAG
jgi:DNA-binding transcriptional MerR regulator